MSIWYSKSFLCWLLIPFSALFWVIISIRKKLYQWNVLSMWKAPVPLIIVGNLSVGGNGKTPLVILLTQFLHNKGLKVGIISRGYGGKSHHYPLLVTKESDPNMTGDEPILLAKRTGAYVAISPNRRDSCELLLNKYDIDVIISDDGLQHYKLQRDMEIVVIDGARGFGNGFLLPAGPLRELPSRLNSVDAVVYNGVGVANDGINALVMRLIPTHAINLLTGEHRQFHQFTKINAVAGIGNPNRFFTMLSQELAINLVKTHSFSDHHHYHLDSFDVIDDADIALFMTEKDAVKCARFAKPNWWYVPISAEISDAVFYKILDNFLDKKEIKYES